VGIINPNSINLINEKRRLFDGPPVLNQAINNKVVYFVQTLTINYLSLLNPIPIFFNGSENYQFNPPHTGLIYFIFLPFFYFGLYKYIKLSSTNVRYQTLLIMFAIVLLPAALTVGDFPSIRASTAIPFYFILISYGLSKFTKYKIIVVLMVIISLVQTLLYLNKYFHYNTQYSQAWQYGYQEAVNYVKSNYSSYQQIIITKKYGEPHEFVLFYWPWDPYKFQNDQKLVTDYHSDWYWVDSFDKFRFVNDWEINKLSPPPQTLLVTSPGNYPPKNSKILKKIYFLDGTLAFEIVSYE